MVYAALHEIKVKDVDLKTAFLHGVLTEDIYIEVPDIPSMVLRELMKQRNRADIEYADIIMKLCNGIKSNYGQFALKLNRSVYSLKQEAK